MNPSLNEALAPLLTEYGLAENGNYERRSGRSIKNNMRMISWLNSKTDIEVFIYEDNTVGLRNSRVSEEVQVDLNMADPESCQKLERWLIREGAKNNDSL